MSKNDNLCQEESLNDKCFANQKKIFPREQTNNLYQRELYHNSYNNKKFQEQAQKRNNMDKYQQNPRVNQKEILQKNQQYHKKKINQKNIKKEHDIAKKLFKEAQNNNTKYIHEFIKLFLKTPIEMRQRFNFGMTEKSGFGLEHYAAWYNNLELLEFLIYDGNSQVNLNRKNNEGVTPIMMASLGGFKEAVQILINLVDINSQDIQGNTALHYAIIKRHVKIAEILINRKDIQINIKNCNLQTPQELMNFGEQIDNKTRQKFVDLFNSTLNKMTQKNKTKNLNKDYIVSTKEEIYSNKNLNQKIQVSDFKFIQQIGSGTFGKVFLVQQISTKIFYAMKVLKKKHSSKIKYKRQVLTERNILSSINHPFIGKLIYAFQTDNFLFLVMEYYPGGSLRDYIQREIRIKESVARKFAAELVLAIEELHNQNIIFRDLKPENIMINDDGHLKLIDFGLSKEGIFNYNGGGQSFCGSLNYLSPEMVLKKGYGKAIDWYSLGVVIHELLTGAPYCYCNQDEGILFKIQFQQPDYPSFLSEVAIDFLERLLQKNPQKRLGSNYGVMEIKQHAWFASIEWNDVLNKKLQMPKPYIQEINFQNISVFRQFQQDSYKNFSQNKFNGWSFHGNIL